MFVLLGYMDCILVQYKSGTIIKQQAMVTTGSTTMNLIVKVPTVVNTSEHFYYRPCQYGERLRTELIKLQSSKVNETMQQFTVLCKTFGRIKRIVSRLHEVYTEQTEHSRESIDLLMTNQRYQTLKNKRSLFSGLRYVFNLGSYSEQAKLQSKVRDLQEQQFTTNGEIIGLKFVIAHEAEKIKQLQQSAQQVSKLMNSFGDFSNMMADELNGYKVLNYYRDQMLYDLLTAGLLTNQLFNDCSDILHDQMNAFALLSRHYLPPSLLAPQDLHAILRKLVEQLQSEHQYLSLQHEDIYKYYRMNNVESFMQGNCYYMQIPVLLKFYRQSFHMYSLAPFHLPLANQPGRFMRIVHQPFIAVNKIAGTFVTLDANWKETLSCRGRHNVYCKSIMTETYMNGAQSCELAIIQNKTAQIKNNCMMAMVDSKGLSTKIHQIRNNTILLENTKSENIYMKCMKTNKREFLTSETLAELDVPCFCSLSSDTMTSSLITSDSCIDTLKVKMYNPLKNLIFLDLLLNETVLENITLAYIPRLEMPNLITDFEIETDSHLLNLKDVLSAHKSSYFNTVHSTLARHESMAESFSFFKICAYMSPIIGIIVVAVVLFFCIRTRRLGQLLSLLSISKSSEALPLGDSKDANYSELLDFIASIGSLFLIVLGLIYLCVKYYKLFVRLQRTISLPFNECISARSPPSYKIALYLSSFNSYCYLYIDNVLKYPEKVVTVQIDTEIKLTFHSTMCNSYVSLNNTDITLVLKDQSYKLPDAVSVPYMLRHTVKSILASDYKAEVLIGSGSHFKTLVIQSLTKNLPLPVKSE